jgi:hypothetical protein
MSYVLANYVVCIFFLIKCFHQTRPININLRSPVVGPNLTYSKIIKGVLITSYWITIAFYFSRRKRKSHIDKANAIQYYSWSGIRSTIPSSKSTMNHTSRHQSKQYLA